MERSFRRSVAILVPGAVLVTVAAGCAVSPVPLQTPSAAIAPSSAFPLSPGMGWTYNYLAHQPGLTSDVISATYVVTETVVSVTATHGDRLAEVRQQHRLVAADADWDTTESGLRPTTWYLVRGTDVYELNEAPDLSWLDVRYSLLAYRLPLAVGVSWCPYEIDGTLTDCIASGKRTVVERRALDTRIGRLNPCYRITEDYTSGGAARWVCDGVGLVDERYDHGGTPFGHRKELVKFWSGGAPSDSHSRSP